MNLCQVPTPSTTPNTHDRLPLREKLTFAIGVNMDYVSTGLLISVLWMPIFNIGFGLDPVILGIILMALRAGDAMIDPIVGNLSDNAQTRWGRRRPFMFVGCLLTAATYPLLWYLPYDWSSFAKVVYLLIVGMTFFACFSTWSMPYYGLQLELTSNYDERTRVTMWMAFFGKIFWMCGGWVLALVTTLGLFVNQRPEGDFLRRLTATGHGEHLLISGMRATCWILVLSIVVFGLLPALFARERFSSQTTSQKQARDPFWKSLKESACCGPLWILMGASTFLSLGSNSVAALGQYMNIYYVNGGDLAKASVIGGWKGTVSAIFGIACLPLFTKLGERYDKRIAAMTVLGMTIAGHLLYFFCLNPAYPYLQILPGIFEGCALGAIWMFLPSMKADVADYDEVHTARRREGSINAFYSWFLKLAGTLAIGFGGYVLKMTGFNASLGAQPPEVLGTMFWIFLILPTVFWSLSLFLISFYPISRNRATEIRALLEQRRGAI